MFYCIKSITAILDSEFRKLSLSARLCRNSSSARDRATLVICSSFQISVSLSDGSFSNTKVQQLIYL